MNKKFSTLLACTLLAASVGATNTVGSFPTQTPVGNGVVMKSGDMMVLSPDLYYKEKDVLALKDVAVTNATKGMIDSLIFVVQRNAGSEIWGQNAKIYEEFVFTSKAGKFAFSKPSGPVAAAKLNVNGALNTWRIAKAVTDVVQSSEMYAPYIVATRKTDGTPKSVYVLASLLKDMEANEETGEIDAEEGSLQIIQVEWNDCLANGFSESYQKKIIFPSDKEYAEFCEVNNNDGKGEANATHKIFRIKGNVISDASVKVPAANIKDLLGYQNPSFDFSNAVLNVSAEEENLLAAYNWVYTTEGYLKAIGAKQAVTGKDLYLTTDTFFYDNQNGRNVKLALDTLPQTGSSTKWVRTLDTYKFDIRANYGSDSISVVAKAIPAYAESWTEKGQIQCTTGDAAIVVKKFGSKSVLTTKDATDDFSAPLIVASEFPTKELNDETVAQFTKGDVYVIYDMNKVKADKTANPDYGKALIIDNMSNRSNQIFAKAEKFDKTLPSHQWVALKKNNINVYTFKNRETAADVNATAASGNTALTDVQLFVANATEKLYTYGDRKDTIKLEKINTVSPFDGYNVISKEEQMNNVFNLRFVSELLGEEAFVQQGADSVMQVLPGNKANAAEIRLLNFPEYSHYHDTIKLGVQDYQLKVIPYAIKIGRYFLAYDNDKKVYRFINKQAGEALGEIDSKVVEYSFVITKLVGGKIALVPYSTVLNGSQDKLAIDSENGKAVRVALNSDLRHTFELTTPENRIFAQVLPKANSTLVDVAFHSVENLGWKVAKGEDNFIYEGVPSLKAGGAEYEQAAFNFKLDTAYVQRTGNTMPLYYITYNATRGDSLAVEHIHNNGKDHVCPDPIVNDTVSGQFLFIMEDSLNISREKDLLYGYTYNPDQRVAKLQFVNAKHIGNSDKLIVNPGRVTPMSMDTLYAGEIKADARPEQIQGQWLGDNENKALFAFRVNMDNKDEYAIYNPATGKYISYLNGFLVATSEYASFYTLKDINGGSVDNEKIEDAVSAISVTAKAGAVEIAGAAGKRVVISNVLGQVVANTVIASDNATIAAPAGVVVVAVEGEAAVKAIVK